MPQEIIYNDIDIKFVVNPFNNSIPLLKNEAAIARSIKNLVFTNKYERPYKSYLYTDALASLFENFSILEANVLQDNIIRVINNYEPRAELLDVSVKVLPDSHKVNVAIFFRPINSINIVEINVFLERIR